MELQHQLKAPITITMINSKTRHMNKIIIALAIFLWACSGTTQQQDKQQADTANEKETVAAVQLNNGSKWKVDEATRNNVAMLRQIVSDTTQAATPALAAALQSRLDSLVSQCTMQGPDHEALHQWLQPIIHSVKEMKEEKDEAGEQKKALPAIRKELAMFDTYFQ
jgi:hypothetical protein